MIRFLVVISAVLLVFTAEAQKTIKLMQYNLLNYGNNTSYCDQTNNNIDDKTDNIKTIIDHVMPDILVVNEMDNDLSDVIKLQGSGLNVNGRNYYESANILNQQNSYLINMLYYDSRILSLEEQFSVSTWPRDINIYRLKYSENGNDIDFYVSVAHLKAGYDDDQARADMTEDFMNYISSHPTSENWIFAGDLNLYSASEQAYQNLINPSEGIRFLDPVNQYGDWNNESAYSDYHTQSTHYSDNGCASWGGLDSRFDFILINDAVKGGNSGMEYVEFSYETLGQDGNHFNDAINYGPNVSEPAEIIDALYNTSDHLPVIAEFDLAGGSGVADVVGSKGMIVKDIRASASSITFNLFQTNVSSGKIQLISPEGRVIKTNNFKSEKEQKININSNYNGMLIVRLISDSGSISTFKIVKLKH